MPVRAADPFSVREALESAARSLARSEPRAALDALAPVTRAEPDNPWMWFYTGSAHLALREPYPAMESFDRALDVLASLGDPDPALAETIRRHRRTARRQVFHIAARTGVAYDSNVTFLGGGVSGPGLIANQGDGLIASAFQLDFAPIADADQTLTVGARLGHSRQYSVESFNFQAYGGYVRYTRSLDSNVEAAIEYDYDASYLGNESFLSVHGLSPSLSYRWPRSAGRFAPDRTSAFYRIEARDFLFATTPSFDRDGFANTVGIEQAFRFRPLAESAWTWNLRVGYQFQSVATQGREFDRLTQRFHAELDVPIVDPRDPNRYLILPDKALRCRLAADWQHDDYRNESLIDRDGDERADWIRTLSLIVSQTLIDDPHQGELTLHAFIRWTDADSNVTTRDRADPFTYDKIVSGLQLEWAW